MGRAVPAPDPVEVLANTLLGSDPAAPLFPPARGGGLRDALEPVLLAALASSPCVVSFSGGRDSSAVLALATDVARRHGLAPPVPVIMRFPRDSRSDESDWQELVLGHLGIERFEVLTLTDELDALGPLATGVLRRHGVRWPANAYMHRPVIDLAAGGAVLTGAGGDELLDYRVARRRPRQWAVARLPQAARATIRERRNPPPTHRWLTEEGARLVRRALARDEVSWPYGWDAEVRHWYGTRHFAAMDGVIDLIARDHGVRVVNPLLDPHVLAELAAIGGRSGFPDRTTAMRRLCGDLLPEAVLSRPGKAVFGGAVWGPATREFVAGWKGEGIDERYVDVRRLRAELSGESPDASTGLLLAQAWLSAASS